MNNSKQKILIIYTQLDKPLSGGQVIDFYFIEQLRKSKKLECKYLLNSIIPNLSIPGYIHYTISNIRKIKKNDIIFTNSRLYPRLLPCFLILKLFCPKIKIITYHHHFNFYTQKGFLKRVHKLFELLFLKTCNSIIIPSPYIKDEMKKILPKSNIRYIKIGFNVNLDIYKNNYKTNELLFVGTVEKRKGVKHLILLAKFLVAQGIKFKLNIVGTYKECEYVDLIRKMIADNNLEGYVSLLGRVELNSLESLYKNSKIFVFPSLHEGYGMVLIEAMSYGLPIIAFNNSAMPYTIISGYNGLLAQDGNQNDFNKKVKQLITDENLYNKLQMGAYETIQNIQSIQLMKEEMKKFINGSL
jgi:glycosyltransferase involved in cell wall biosynthesis